MSACPDPAHRHLHLAPVPCHTCRAWLDRDGTPMSTQTMLGRYPHMRSVIAAQPAQQLPDWTPSRGEALMEMNRIAGALARTLIMVLISAAALALVIVFLVHVA